MQAYYEMKKIAKEHGYIAFTALQECAFQTDDTFSEAKNLFVIGQTSSGKTLIPLLLYEYALRDARIQKKRTPKMLFVVPYRALAAQKLEEFRKHFSKYPEIQIVQSTGEFRQDDPCVLKGEAEIAIVITEKVFKFSSRDPEFLAKYDYIVLDEIGILDNQARGVRMDFILTWSRSCQLHMGRPRIIALGTPFFDWSTYIDCYDFCKIQVNDEKRPIEPKDVQVYYNNKSNKEIIDVVGECSFLSKGKYLLSGYLRNLRNSNLIPASYCEHLRDYCAYSEPCRTDANIVCPHLEGSCAYPVIFAPEEVKSLYRYLLLKICREHLMQQHQVLIFINNRQEVKDICLFLYEHLRDLLKTPPAAKDCREKVLQECKLNSEDLYGIMETDQAMESYKPYEAFLSGVGFHSSALPNELRSYVERQFLGSREMKIVCSTETLAYGVNSSVDVVLVADLKKQEDMVIRPLTLNEYQNYCGRAGRLSRDKADQVSNAYTYTLIRGNEREIWQKLCTEQKEIPVLSSHLYRNIETDMPFYILNLMKDGTYFGKTRQQLLEMMKNFPNGETLSSEILLQRLNEALQFLIEEKMITREKSISLRKGSTNRANQYRLTKLGENLLGFIISTDDYYILLEAIKHFTDSLYSDPDIVTFLYDLLRTGHVESGLNSVFYNSTTKFSLTDLFNNLAAYFDDGTIPQWLYDCNNESLLSVLAAVVTWSKGSSAKKLYQEFGIHYALLSKVTEKLGYLIEIATNMLPSYMESIWEEKSDTYQKIMSSCFTDQMTKRLAILNDLSSAVYYGVNTTICRELECYLNNTGDPKAMKLAKELSLQHINPSVARDLRRIGVRYHFFAHPPIIPSDDVQQKNNYNNQYQQYQRDIEKMGREKGPYIVSFFNDCCPNKNMEENI